MLVNLTCPNCGAALPATFSISGIVACEYCGTSFRVPKSLTPQPDMGDLILGADFSHKPIPGWQIQSEDRVTLVPGRAAELRAAFEASERVHYCLSSSGIFDNVDAGVTIRFIEGKIEWVRAALFLRYTTGMGGYGFFISAQGTCMIGYYEKPQEGELAWQTVMDWTAHTALRHGLDQPNRLRVIANGKRLQVYLNGVMATTFQHAHHEMGQVRLAVEPGERSAAHVAFSDLQLRAVA